MIGQDLKQLQGVLDGKADAAQHEFVALGEQLKNLGLKLAELPAEERAPLAAEQATLRDRQQALAEDINVWRDRARAVTRQASEAALKDYLEGLRALGDPVVHAAAAHVLEVLETPEEERTRQVQVQEQARSTTPVGRLLERARGEYDLRGADPAPRRRAAFEFANRPGLAQNEATLAELEAVYADPDPLVAEILTLSLVQLYRFRALNLADLDAVNAAVERLVRLKQPAVVPVLIEVMATPRTGFMQENGRMVAGDNQRARAAALAGLAEWRTAEVQAALRARQRDRDPEISQAAQRVLAQYPGEWHS